MKSIIKDGQWTITITTTYKPRAIAPGFSKRADWIEFTKRNKYKRNRANADRFACGCCKVEWEEAEGTHVSLVSLEKKPNTIICEACTDQLKQQGVPTIGTDRAKNPTT